jgi:hypothetical protein
METSKRSKQITTAGSVGSFQGFINAHTAAQLVGISGPFCFNSSGANVGYTLQVGVGQIVPISCTYIQPQSGNVIGFLP